MDLFNLMLAAAAIAAGSAVQRASGVGTGFIVVPLIAMIDVEYLPGPLVLATISLSALMAWREWSAVDFRAIPWVLTGFVPGAAAGAWALTVIAPGQIGFLFGGVILFAVLLTSLGLHPPLNPFSSLVAGSVAGAMGASSGVGAPPLAILYHRSTGAVLRATLAVLYTVCSILILIVLAFFGNFGADEALTGVLLTPGFFIGYLLGAPFVAYVEAAGVRTPVLVLSAAAAVALIVKSF